MAHLSCFHCQFYKNGAWEGGASPRPLPKLVEAPSNFIAGRLKAALLFWLFGGLRCDVPLFIVILVINKYKNRYKWMLIVRLAGGHLYGKQLFT